MKFSGNALDSETSLYATPGAYQPSTGTVLAPVASSGSSSNPQNLNPYAGLGQQIGQQMGQMSNSYSAGATGISGGFGFSGQGECDDICYDLASTSGDLGNYSTTTTTTYVIGGSVTAPSGNTDTGTDPAPPALPPSTDQSAINATLNMGDQLMPIPGVEQDALTALDNPAVAQVVDGGTGVAAVILQANMYNQANAAAISAGDLLPMQTLGVTVQFGDLRASTITDTGYSGTGGVTIGALQPGTLLNGILVSGGVGAPWTITLNSNPDGGFIEPLRNPDMPAIYSFSFLQTVTLLHELGHAASGLGYPSAIVYDDSNSAQSMQNSAAIAAAFGNP
jgi:hypothetical protein